MAVLTDPVGDSVPVIKTGIDTSGPLVPKPAAFSLVSTGGFAA